MLPGRLPTDSRHTHESELFRALIKQARQTVGISQEEAAKRLGWPQSVVAKIEGGERRMDVIEFLYYCETVGFDGLKLLREVRNDLRDRKS